MILGVQELTKVSKEIVACELNPMEVYLFAALVLLVPVAYFFFRDSVKIKVKHSEAPKHAAHNHETPHHGSHEAPKHEDHAKN